MTSEKPEQMRRRPELIEQEAIAWFTRINGEPTSADRKNFERWRKGDPANEAAYRDVAASWSATAALGSRVAAREAETLQGYLNKITEGRKRRARIATAASVAGAVLVCASSFLAWRDHPNFFQNLTADYYTARAERRLVTLADGSSVTLDADSAISQEMDGSLRKVRLLRGAAFFDVVKSPVPFIVEAGAGETRVTGTAFSVETAGDDATVTLERGNVTVAGTVSALSEHLVPGQSVSYGDAGMSPVTQVAVDEVLSWRDGRLIFDRVRLGDVIRHIGRYRAGRIVVVGDALAERKVSGNLPLDDPDSALASLQATVGFSVTHVGSNLVVVRP